MCQAPFVYTTCTSFERPTLSAMSEENGRRLNIVHVVCLLYSCLILFIPLLMSRYRMLKNTW